MAGMSPVVLQFCADNADLVDHVTNFEFFKAFSCAYIGSVGIALTATLVYGAIAIPIQLRTDSVMIPVVLLLLTGGATFATIAGPAVSIGTILLILAGPGAITLALYAYSR